MMSKRLLIAAVLCITAYEAGRADEQIPSGFRAALLIGNSAYDGFELKGVAKSLDEVAKSVTREGYAVTRHENLEKKAMEAAVEAFAKTVPTNGIVVVYYAGLAAHVKRLGKQYNLLRPVGGRAINNENDYRGSGADLVKLIQTMESSSGARRTVIFLDGCWDSPIKPKTDAVQNGFTSFEVSDGITVAFAASEGKTVPVLTNDESSAFAKAIASRLSGLEASINGACKTITSSTGGAWIGGVDRGIGKRDSFPVADTLRGGKSAGEGYVNSFGMTFRWCPAGGFTMGASDTDSAGARDRQAVDVTLSKGFWIGEHEVTQREYYAVLRKSVSPRDGIVHKQAPFWGIEHSKTVVDFCKKLTELEKKAGRLPAGWAYHCPTEAEWEYACRAGSTSSYCYGDSVAELGLYGNFADKALWTANPNYHWAERSSDDGVAETLALVGSYRPNAWGIRDMHGNVAELVQDHLSAELIGGTDPLFIQEKDGRTQIRGGAWCSVPQYCESSFRNTHTTGGKVNFVGCRVVLKKIK